MCVHGSGISSTIQSSLYSLRIESLPKSHFSIVVIVFLFLFSVAVCVCVFCVLCLYCQK
jgi:hypothetical protein